MFSVITCTISSCTSSSAALRRALVFTVRPMWEYDVPTAALEMILVGLSTILSCSSTPWAQGCVRLGCLRSGDGAVRHDFDDAWAHSGNHALVMMTLQRRIKADVIGAHQALSVSLLLWILLSLTVSVYMCLLFYQELLNFPSCSAPLDKGCPPHHTLFRGVRVWEVQWLTHQTTAHTHTMSKVCNLQPSGTPNTHTPCCVLSLCLVFKSPGNAPPLKLLRSPSMPSSVSPALSLELLWPIWIQLEPHYRNVHILSLWACKTFCLYYNAPQNGLLAVIGFLANLQIMNKINNVRIHPPCPPTHTRRSRPCQME